MLKRFIHFIFTSSSPPRDLPEPPAALGWLPALSIIGAVGLCVVAVANTGARMNTAWAEPLFYIGLTLLYLPGAVRLCMPVVSRRERLWLVVFLAVGLLFTKLLHSPTGLVVYDELLHWRTLTNLIQMQKLYEANTLLPVSAFYPGLHIITQAILLLTGVDVYTAVILTILFARVMLVMILFHLFEIIGGSARVAAIACAVYMTNQSFFIFDAMYAYQTMALPFLFAVIFGVAARMHHTEPQRHYGWSLLVIAAMSALTITHHVTSYFMMGFLGLWLGVYVFFRLFLRDRLAEKTRPPVWSLAIAFVFIFSWMIYVATSTLGYLVPVLTGTISDLLKIIAREESGRQLFVTEAAGLATPLWERLSVLFSIAVVGLALLAGWWFLWRYHRYKLNYVVLVLISMGYPVIQVFRFTARGPELTGRFAPSLYLGVGFVVAFGIHYLWRTRDTHIFIRGAVTAGLLISFIGGVNLSYLRWGRQPGPYIPASESRSIDPEGIEAALWALENLGQYNFFAADRISGVLFTAFGLQNQITVSYYNVFVPAMYTALNWTEEEEKILCEGDFVYLIVDERLSTDVPRVGFYIESGEPRPDQDRSEPLPAAALQKFDTLEGVNRMFDSGSIILYDVTEYDCDH